MTHFLLYTRSFHPDRNFGLGGLGFEGDNRGFSADPGATARIYHRVRIDLRAARFVDPICRSDPSSNQAIPRILEGRPGRAGEVIARDELADRNIHVPDNPISRARDILPPMRNDYSQPRKLPRHNITGRITSYREDGDQAVNGRLSYAGKNFAFYGADTDLGHAILGGNVSDGGSDTSGGSWRVWERWNGVVPDLDVTHEFSLRINRNEKKIHLTSAITGDGFPNCESFLIDSSGRNTLFLGSHIRIGTAATQLPGGRALPMTRTLLAVDWLEGDLFGSNVSVQLATDYTGSGGPQQIVAPGQMTRESWNGRHTGRNASGDWIRSVEDHIPLPRQTLRRVRDQIRRAF